MVPVVKSLIVWCLSSFNKVRLLILLTIEYLLHRIDWWTHLLVEGLKFNTYLIDMIEVTMVSDDLSSNFIIGTFDTFLSCGLATLAAKTYS